MWRSFVLLFLSWSVGAQVLIPPDRLTDWRAGIRTGVIGGRWTRTPFTNVVGLDNTGSSDVSAALLSICLACPSNKSIVLPSGNFLLTSSIGQISDTTLTGQPDWSTTLILNGDVGWITHGEQDIFYAHHNLGDVGTNVLSGATLGSSNVTVATTLGFVIGQEIELSCSNAVSQGNGLVIVSVSSPYLFDSGQYNVNRKAIVTATNATQITFWPPLPNSLDYSTNGAQVIKPGDARPQQYIGLENLVINATNSIHSFDVSLGTANNCWLYNVRINGAQHYACYIYDSINPEVRHCWFGTTSGTGPNHALILGNNLTAYLIEDNIFESSQPAIEMNFGSCSGVVGYNFSTNANTGGIGFDSNHGPHNMDNLWEGNVGPELMSDSFFGSESTLIVFRNWFHGVDGYAFDGFGNPIPGSNQTWPIKLCRFNRNDAVVGNIIGNAGVGNINDVYGEPQLGSGSSSGFAPPWAQWGTAPGPNGFQELDQGVTNSYTYKGNYHVNTATLDSLQGGTLSNSLYYASAPSWFGTVPWPPIVPGPPPDMRTVLPATIRYFFGTNQPPANQMIARVTNLRVTNGKIGQ